MDNKPLAGRRAGVLLHPTSLPSGNLDEAEQWIDWLSNCHFSIWQMLPLTIPDAHGSPYQSNSAFAMNPALMSNLTARPEILPTEFGAFVTEQTDWINDFALFSLLKKAFEQKPWYEWPEAYKYRETETLDAFRSEHNDELADILWQQFQLFQRWYSIRDYAHSKGVYLFGDIPIFVAHDSADVWANPGEFLLDKNLNPTFVTGVPPDYFSETGQRWGNPHYNWNVMQEEGFSWWKLRLKHAFDNFDIIRIDHFRGLQASWMIPAEEETAINGFWQETPGDALLDAVCESLHNPSIVAEDLGVITKEVRQLRDDHHLPGMSILQFAFDAFEDNPHKPVNFAPETVVYTGTHDNNTTHGWFKHLLPNERSFVFEVLGIAPRDDIALCLAETALHSKANTAMIPLQDLLQLDEDARMNTPGVTENNWLWRFDWQQLNEKICSFSQHHIAESGRLHAN